ncbi:MAG: cache domain-containing protein [Candidatus Omnitrophota bacterium]
MKKLAELAVRVFLFIFLFSLPAHSAEDLSDYQYKTTKDLVSLVRNAAGLVTSKGEAAFTEFKKEGSAWRHGNLYIFVLDTDGNMLVHPDPALSGKNEIDLKDINNKPIIKNILEVATGYDNKGEGWFHYQWPEPGSIFPMWKTTFAKRCVAPSGKTYVIGSGLYNMKIEKCFIISAVDDAVALIEKEGKNAFPVLRDKSGPFLFMNIYIFVDDPKGVELVNPAFPNVEGKNLMDYQDSTGKLLVQEYIALALNKGLGWIDYMWPKPGESTLSRKHAYVRKAVYNNETFIVGSGAYLE